MTLKHQDDLLFFQEKLLCNSSEYQKWLFCMETLPSLSLVIVFMQYRHLKLKKYSRKYSNSILGSVIEFHSHLADWTQWSSRKKEKGINIFYQKRTWSSSSERENEETSYFQIPKFLSKTPKLAHLHAFLLLYILLVPKDCPRKKNVY